jgi:hypothetical protein
LPAPATDESRARTELKRVVQRWQQLPLDEALSRMPDVRSVVQRLADLVAEIEGREPIPVPDLGPAVVMDQLTVMVYDAVGAGLDITGDLTELRRSLA